MQVLLIGSGGREHALAMALARSPLLSRLYVAPGNPGTAEHGSNVALDVADHAAVVAFCRQQAIDLVVIGPEAPLVAGLVDDLALAGIKAFGPTRAAARLEASKAFTKEICDDAGIPTATYAAFNVANAAKAYIAAMGAPIVVKFDGLAAGKGVVVAQTIEEGCAAVDRMFAEAGGDADVVIEECLEGEEVSLFCLVGADGVLPFGTAKDHKRALDGDQGPNTGGMGAISPAPRLTPALLDQAMAEIVRPTLEALAARKTPYRGILYAGLMLTADGPKLIEYNCRFGDPECQALMLRLDDDLLPLLLASVDDGLAGKSVAWSDRAAVTVVLAAGGYPAAPRRGTTIGGVARASALDGVTVFHAGTALDQDRLVAVGGRVLNVSATGTSIDEARTRAYAAVDAIDWPEGFCRRDIGLR